MNTETVTVLPKGEDFEIIVQHDQSGSAYGITLSKNAYEQLRKNFVSGSACCGMCEPEEIDIIRCKYCGGTDIRGNYKHTWCGDCKEIHKGGV
jgi:hypothetical protein